MITNRFCHFRLRNTNQQSRNTIGRNIKNSIELKSIQFLFWGANILILFFICKQFNVLFATNFDIISEQNRIVLQIPSRIKIMTCGGRNQPKFWCLWHFKEKQHIDFKTISLCKCKTAEVGKNALLAPLWCLTFWFTENCLQLHHTFWCYSNSY